MEARPRRNGVRSGKGLGIILILWGVLMLESLVALLAHLLSWMFLIGGIGCIFVIPIVAYRLFAVIFEPDTEADI